MYSRARTSYLSSLSPCISGFSSSYSEVQKFKRSAALVHSTETLSPVETKLVQSIADNVDHNVRSIDGFNTFNGMGIIASFTLRKVKAKYS